MSSAGLYLGLIVVPRRRRCAIATAPGSGSISTSSARSTTRARSCVSLASRVRFETDPADLAAMVVGQIDEALHPDMVAILVSGIEQGQLVPVTVLHGSADSLPLDGGLGGDAALVERAARHLARPTRARRSAGCRPTEQEWLHCTGAALLVPVLGAGPRAGRR